mmetsp:Transcript_6550/g.12944  ORF Transcript_6550/g.12944 Transcript_6550/m.12944 type:complete len:230 (-) Transcript_6550:169-858(-)
MHCLLLFSFSLPSTSLPFAVSLPLFPLLILSKVFLPPCRLSLLLPLTLLSLSLLNERVAKRPKFVPLREVFSLYLLSQRLLLSLIILILTVAVRVTTLLSKVFSVIVSLSLLWIIQGVIRLGHPLEGTGGPPFLVGVVFEAHQAVGLLQLLLCHVSTHTQHTVVILLCRDVPLPRRLGPPLPVLVVRRVISTVNAAGVVPALPALCGMSTDQPVKQMGPLTVETHEGLE